MRCWSIRAPLALLALLLGSGQALAADDWPTPLFAGVVIATEGEPDPAVVARSLNEAISLLVGSGLYRIRTQDELVERLGGPPGELVVRCEDDLACWQTVLWRSGTDLVVLIELATPGDGSLPVTRVSAWSGEGPLVAPAVVGLPRGGGAPLEWMAGVLLVDGLLAARVSEGGSVSLDGAAWDPAAGPRTLRPGRHQVRVQFGDEVQVKVLPVLPGGVTDLALAPAPPEPAAAGAHRRWGLVAMPALAAGGVVALVVQKDRPGDAAR